MIILFQIVSPVVVGWTMYKVIQGLDTIQQKERAKRR